MHLPPDPDKVASFIAQPLHEGLARLEQAAGSANADLRTTLLGEARAKFTDVLARPAAPASVRVAAAPRSPRAGGTWTSLTWLVRQSSGRSTYSVSLLMTFVPSGRRPTSTATGGPAPPVEAPQQPVHWRPQQPSYHPLGLTGYGVKKFMERQADSRRKAGWRPG